MNKLAYSAEDSNPQGVMKGLFFESRNEMITGWTKMGQPSVDLNAGIMKSIVKKMLQPLSLHSKSPSTLCLSPRGDI